MALIDKGEDEYLSKAERNELRIELRHQPMPAKIDVKAIRARRGLISTALVLPVLGIWERRRFSPDPTARAYLTIIDRAPEAVEEALTRAV
jgi:DNA-binding transcriptional regulator YiaG